MIGIVEHSFKNRPAKDGQYLVFENDGGIWTPWFTTEYGWNTRKYADGTYDSIFTIPDEEMAENCKCWCNVKVSRESWFDTIDLMLDEVDAERIEIEPKTEEDYERHDLLEELSYHLEKAKDFAEDLR